METTTITISGPLDNVQVGDHLIRNLGGINIPVTVTRIKNDKIYCGPWKFDMRTGAEIDKDLNWGPHGTGSYLSLS
jgi:hypothetical protein